VLAFLKGPERYYYVYDDASHPELLQALRDQAADPASFKRSAVLRHSTAPMA